jgi:hypothetical protein
MSTLIKMPYALLVVTKYEIPGSIEVNCDDVPQRLKENTTMILMYQEALIELIHSGEHFHMPLTIPPLTGCAGLIKDGADKDNVEIVPLVNIDAPYLMIRLELLE